MTPSRSAEKESRKAENGVPSGEFARGLAEAALTKKAGDLVIMDLRKLTNITDYFVVGTVSTDVHSRAVEEAIDEWAKNELGVRMWHLEGGEGTRTWVLMDYVDVVVHLFQPDAREYYSLERLWGDAPQELVMDPDD